MDLRKETLDGGLFIVQKFQHLLLLLLLLLCNICVKIRDGIPFTLRKLHNIYKGSQGPEDGHKLTKTCRPNIQV